MEEGYVVAINTFDDGFSYLQVQPEEETYLDVDEVEEATIFDTKKEAEGFVKRWKDTIFDEVGYLVEELAIEIYKVKIKMSATTKLVKSYPYEGE